MENFYLSCHESRVADRAVSCLSNLFTCYSFYVMPAKKPFSHPLGPESWRQRIGQRKPR